MKFGASTYPSLMFESKSCKQYLNGNMQIRNAREMASSSIICIKKAPVLFSNSFKYA